MKNNVKYPYITINLSKLEGENAFTIIGKVTRILKESGVGKEELDEFFTQATASDYENVLSVYRMYVNII